MTCCPLFVLSMKSTCGQLLHITPLIEKKEEEEEEMVRNVDQYFTKPGMMSSNVLFHLQLKAFLFTVTEGQKNNTEPSVEETAYNLVKGLQ